MNLFSIEGTYSLVLHVMHASVHKSNAELPQDTDDQVIEERCSQETKVYGHPGPKLSLHVFDVRLPKLKDCTMIVERIDAIL